MASFIDKILGLRPKENTAASLRDALDRARENLCAAEARVTELERNRGALMLRGTAADMKTGEENLAAARLDADRLKSLILSLEAEVPAAEAQEVLDQLKREIAEAKAMRAEFVTRWRKEYAPAAQKIAELLHLEIQVEEARGRAVMTASSAQARGVDAAAIDAAVVGFPGNSASAEIDPAGAFMGTAIGGSCRLPGIAGDADRSIIDHCLWPPRGPLGQRL